MRTLVHNETIVVASRRPTAHLKTIPNRTNNNNEMTAMQEHEINRKLAHEFIESRLDAPTSEENIEKLALLIAEMEAR